MSFWTKISASIATGLVLVGSVGFTKPLTSCVEGDWTVVFDWSAPENLTPYGGTWSIAGSGVVTDGWNDTANWTETNGAFQVIYDGSLALYSGEVSGDCSVISGVMDGPEWYGNWAAVKTTSSALRRDAKQNNVHRAPMVRKGLPVLRPESNN
jgi:hypothetical protein